MIRLKKDILIILGIIDTIYPMHQDNSHEKDNEQSVIDVCHLFQKNQRQRVDPKEEKHASHLRNQSESEEKMSENELPTPPRLGPLYLCQRERVRSEDKVAKTMIGLVERRYQVDQISVFIDWHFVSKMYWMRHDDFAQILN